MTDMVMGYTEGWKVFTYLSRVGKLMSPSRLNMYDSNLIEAECRLRGHESFENCKCGIYAGNSLDSIASYIRRDTYPDTIPMLARMRGYGQVVEGDKAWRAEKAEVLELCPLTAGSSAVTDSEFRHLDGIPVRYDTDCLTEINGIPVNGSVSDFLKKYGYSITTGSEFFWSLGKINYVIPEQMKPVHLGAFDYEEGYKVVMVNTEKGVVVSPNFHQIWREGMDYSRCLFGGHEHFSECRCGCYAYNDLNALANSRLLQTLSNQNWRVGIARVRGWVNVCKGATSWRAGYMTMKEVYVPPVRHRWDSNEHRSREEFLVSERAEDACGIPITYRLSDFLDHYGDTSNSKLDYELSKLRWSRL